MAQLRTNIIIDAKTKLKGAFQRTKGFFQGLKKDTSTTNTELGTMEKAFGRLRNTLLGFVGISIFQGLARSLIEVSDSMTLIKGRINVMTDSVKESTFASMELVKIAKLTGTSLLANTTLFTRLNKPIKALGKNVQFTTKFVGFMAKGLRISGATSGEAASSIRQMSQALASGVLRGDEYNSILENGGRVAIALAEGLKVTQGELRKMAEAGELTSSVVIKALESQFDAINREFLVIPKTIGTATQNVKTSFAEMVGASEGMKDASDSLIKGLEFVSNNLSEIVQVGITLTQVLGVTLLGSMANLGAAKIKQLGFTQQLSQAELVYAAQVEKSKVKATEFKSALAVVNNQIKQNITGVKSHIQNLGENINVERLAAKITQRRKQAELDAATAITRSSETLKKHTILIREETTAARQVIQSKKNEIIANNELAIAQQKVSVAQANVNRLRKQSILVANPAVLKANLKDLTRLEKEQALALKQVSVAEKQVAASSTALTASQDRLTASTKANVTAMKARNIASVELGKSTTVLANTTSKVSKTSGVFAKNMKTVGKSLSGVLSIAKGAGIAMLAFSKTLLIGFAVFEAISAIGELATSFFKLKDAEKQMEKADKDLQKQLASNLDTMQKQAIQAGVNIKGIEDNFKALKEATEIQVKHNREIKEAEKFQREYALASRDTEAELKKLAKTNPELAQSIRDSTRQMELQAIGFEKIERNSNNTLLTFAKWRKEAPGSLNVLGDKLNELSDNDFKKFKKSIVDALDAGIGKTKELKGELESINLSEVERAFRKMGLIAQSELKRMAVDTENNYNKIKESGVATAEQLKEAYGKVVQAQIDANNGVVSASIKANAALNNVIVKSGEVVNQVDKITPSFNSAGNAAASFGNTASQATRQVVSDTKQLQANLDGAREAYKDLKASGKATMDELKAATNAVNDAQLQLIKSITANIVALKKQARERESGINEGVNTSNADLVNSRRQNRADDINKRNNANVERTDSNGRRPNKTINRKLDPSLQGDFNALDKEAQDRVNDGVRRNNLRKPISEFQNSQDIDAHLALLVKQETERKNIREREEASSKEAFDKRVKEREAKLKKELEADKLREEQQAQETKDRLARQKILSEKRKQEEIEAENLKETQRKLVKEKNRLAKEAVRIKEEEDRALKDAELSLKLKISSDNKIKLENELAEREASEAEIRRQKRESIILRNTELSADIDAKFLADLDSTLKKRSADTRRIIENIKRGQ